MSSRLFVTALIALCLCSCNVGPRKLEQDYPAFSDSIQRLEDEQLLTNLLRLRYQETPMFLQIGSITTTYGFSASTDVAGTVGSAGEIGAAGAQTGYSETPTISYLIPDSKEIYGTILAPLTANQVTAVGRSGWGMAHVLGICAKRINRLENVKFSANAQPVEPKSFEQFREAIGLMKGLWEEGLIDFAIGNTFFPAGSPLESIEDTLAVPQGQMTGMQFWRDEEGELKAWTAGYYLNLRFHADAEGSPEAERLRELLGLSPDRHTFAILDSYKSIEELRRHWLGERAAALDPEAEFDDIVLQTRSLHEILVYASYLIDVPGAHVEAGIVRPNDDSLTSPFTLRHAVQEPAATFRKVRYRGYWFYIAEDDLATRDILATLQTLVAATTGSTSSSEPILTIPVQ